jgi:hypothetical protein
MPPKLRCYNCGALHKARTDKFPQELLVPIAKRIPNKDKTAPPKYEASYTKVYVCWKCEGKAGLRELKKRIKREKNIEGTVTKQHLREYFKEQRLKEVPVEKPRLEKKKGFWNRLFNKRQQQIKARRKM